MPRKPDPPRDDPEQSKRFIKIAREAGAEETSPEFERVLRKIAATKREKPKRQS